MDKTEKLRLSWAWYFTLTSLAGVGIAVSLIGIMLGWLTGRDIIFLLLPFVASTLFCAYSMFKWLETDKKLTGALKHERNRRSKKK